MAKIQRNIYTTYNYEQTIELCEVTQANHYLTLLQGESGFGKTFAALVYQLSHQNVYVVELEESDKNRFTNMWRRLALQVLGDELYNKYCKDASFEEITNYLIYGLNSKSTDNL